MTQSFKVAEPLNSGGSGGSGAGLPAVSSSNTVTSFSGTAVVPLVDNGTVEYITPANIISDLGNRSSDAGVPAATALAASNTLFVDQGGASAVSATFAQVNNFVGAPPVTTVAASGAAQTLTFPPNGNICYDITLTANCVLTLAGGAAGFLQTMTLIVRQDSTAGRVLTLPSGVKWPNGTAPIPNTIAGVIDVYTLFTSDARATVIGRY